MTDKRTDLKGKDKFLAQLSSFLEKNRKVLYIILGVAVAAIIVTGIVDSVNQRKLNESAVMIEEAQKAYEEWLGLAEDDENKAVKQQELAEQLDVLTADYPSSYAAQRALYLKAGINFQNKEWEEAAVLFADSADVDGDSYLAPISLMLAASSYENAGNWQNALELYERVYTDYDKIYPDVPRAMIAIGRLNEQLGSQEAAVEAYNNLLDTYPGSGWSNFARTRLIQLD